MSSLDQIPNPSEPEEDVSTSTDLQSESTFAEPDPLILPFDSTLQKIPACKSPTEEPQAIFSPDTGKSRSANAEIRDDCIDSDSIEIFYGKFKSFSDCYKYVWNGGKGQTAVKIYSNSEEEKVKVIPETVRKLILVGHPLISFHGVKKFVRLVELLVTNSDIKEAKRSDFEGLEYLQKLSLYNIGLEILEPLKLNALKQLWISGNKLKSLSFLSQGIPTLYELNVAKNEIMTINEMELLQCKSLTILNLSGNPLCTVQDIQSLRILPALKDLYLCDPVYGKCPIASLCDSRNILVYNITNISSLDGKPVPPSELKTIKEYMHSRSLYYYANSFGATSTYVSSRKSAINFANKKLEKLGQRTKALMSLAAKYRRSITNLDINPIFTNAKPLLKEHLLRIEARLSELRSWAFTILERLDTINQISRWEIEMKAWIKMIEFTSSGTIQCSIIHSVHGTLNRDANSICSSVHELLSSLSCTTEWPKEWLLKVETVIMLKDIGREAGLNITYNKYFVKDKEPEFILPEPAIDEIALLQQTFVPNQSNPNSIGAGYPYVSNTGGPQRAVETYMNPDFQYTPPLLPFPEGVPGLVQRARPIFMYLISPVKGFTSSLAFLHQLLNGKSNDYKNIRLSNCLSVATEGRTSSVCVVILVKVLPECLELETRATGQHHFDCGTFSITHPLSITPAYVINVSFMSKDKEALWQTGKEASVESGNDDDILNPAKTALTTLTENNKAKNNLGLFAINRTESEIGGKKKKSPYIRKTADGVLGDLSCSHLYINEKGELQSQNQLPNVPIPQTYFVQSASKYLGTEGSKYVTSLDLSGNSLGMVVGLDGLVNLKKLNISHNKLKTLSTLQKVPQLIEFKVGWNEIRHFHSSSQCLREAFPNLMTLEILPNPFTDIRDYAHMPIMLKRSLYLLHRVDIWTYPFEPITKIGNPYDVNRESTDFESGGESSTEQASIPGPSQQKFETIPLSKSWVGSSFVPFNKFASNCLTDLNSFPQTPPFAVGFATNGIDVDLSDNYLNSFALSKCCLFKSSQWTCALVKLQLQENRIENLDWLEGKTLSNLLILNLSNNFLNELTVLPGVVKNLKHLQVSGNPFPCDTMVLTPLKLLKKLITLDCSNSALSTHPEYGSFVTRHCSSVEILDGQGVSHWELNETIENFGGVLTTDWLEGKFHTRDLSSITELSLPNYNIQKVAISPQSLSKLSTIDLQNNYLSNFTSLSSLPSLRVLCVSHNSILQLGPGTTCPTCFTHTAQSQAEKALRTKRKEAQQDNQTQSPAINAYSPPSTEIPSSSPRKTKSIFPKLEVLIMAHNGLNAMSDLHLHALPQLQTIIFNCNNLTSPVGLDNLPTVKVIVLDNNRISNLPSNSFTGCVNLKYLHLEHNKLTSLPRLPHLASMASLHVGYNKIQSLADSASLSPLSLKELTLIGNPIAVRSDYRLHVAAKYPGLHILDRKELSGERIKLHEISLKLFPGLVQPHQVTKTPKISPRKKSVSSNNRNKGNPSSGSSNITTAPVAGTGLPRPPTSSISTSSPQPINPKILRKKSSRRLSPKGKGSTTGTNMNINKLSRKKK